MKEIKTKTSKVYLKEGILRVDYIDKAKISLPDAMETVEAQKEFIASPSKIPLLVDIRTISSIDSESRNYFIGEESQKIVTKAALWTKSAMSNMIGNFFIGLNKGPIPVKLFSDEDKAISWLREID